MLVPMARNRSFPTAGGIIMAILVVGIGEHTSEEEECLYYQRGHECPVGEGEGHEGREGIIEKRTMFKVQSPEMVDSILKSVNI